MQETHIKVEVNLRYMFATKRLTLYGGTKIINTTQTAPSTKNFLNKQEITHSLYLTLTIAVCE